MFIEEILKMLGLYLHHYNWSQILQLYMLSILNQLTLQTELHSFVTPGDK